MTPDPISDRLSPSCQDPSLDVPVGRPPLRALFARTLASVLRVRSLPLAKWAFRDIERPLVLRRRFFGRDLYVDISRTDTHRLLYVDGERFVVERELIRGLVSPDMEIVEVGANIGYFTLLYDSATRGRARICCLETEPDNLVELRRNVGRNGLAGVEILPLAASDHDGSAHLQLGINGVVGDVGEILVEIRRLDTLLDRKVDFIKIDVEGHEAHVIAGAAGLLHAHRPCVVVEVHPQLIHTPYTVADVFRLLSDSHDKLTVYIPEVRGSLFHRLRVRYLGTGGFRIVHDVAAVMADCDAGHITDPFWVVAETTSAVNIS